MKLWTCSRCERIGRHDDELDGKRICERCLHKAHHGDDVYERCEKRGYHETQSSGGAIVSREELDGTYFRTTVYCLCGRRVTAWMKSPGPDPNAKGFDQFLIPIPSPARFWALVEGEYTPIEESMLPERSVS